MSGKPDGCARRRNPRSWPRPIVSRILSTCFQVAPQCAFLAVLARPRARARTYAATAANINVEIAEFSTTVGGLLKQFDEHSGCSTKATEGGHDVVRRTRRVAGRCSGGGLSTLNARHSPRGLGRQHAVLHSFAGSWTRGLGTRLRCGSASNQQRWLARVCHGTDEVAMTIARAAPPPPDCSTPFLSLDEVALRRHPHGRAVRRRHAVSDPDTRTYAAQHVAR